MAAAAREAAGAAHGGVAVKGAAALRGAATATCGRVAHTWPPGPLAAAEAQGWGSRCHRAESHPECRCYCSAPLQWTELTTLRLPEEKGNVWREEDVGAVAGAECLMPRPDML